MARVYRVGGPLPPSSGRVALVRGPGTHASRTTLAVTEPIAIVAAEGLFADAPDNDAFWRLIVEGRRARRELPAHVGGATAEPLESAAPAPPSRLHHRIASLIGAAAPAPVGWVGPPWGTLDPSVQLAITVAERLRPSLPETERPTTGLVLADIALPTWGSSSAATAAMPQDLKDRLGIGAVAVPAHLDLLPGLAASLIAQVFGLGGPAHSLDAACASSLYALHLACGRLRAALADRMVAGGLCRPDPWFTQIGFSQLRASSPTGRSRPFERGADGLVVGEGCALFVLRRLSDARAAGEPVLAVIRGGGLSNDVGGSLLAPETEGQLRAMRAAYAQADIDPRSVQYIECHGTGTPRGDEVELTSLATLRGGRAAPEAVIGSVKAAVGHTLTAAGAAGLLKIVRAFGARTLPPQPECSADAFVPAVASAGLRALAQPEPWAVGPGGYTRRAALSAFGFGGINAHFVLDESADVDTLTAEPDAALPRIAVVAWTARVGDDHHPFDSSGAGAGSRAGGRDGRIRDFDLDAARLRIPPAEIDRLLPQQLLALELAFRCADATPRRDGQRLRDGVLVGLGFDPAAAAHLLPWLVRSSHTLDGLDAEDRQRLEHAVGPALDAPRTLGALAGLSASRVARALKLGGPSFTLSGGPTAGLDAFDEACALLERGEADTLFVIAVDAPAVGSTEAQRGGGRVDAGVAFVLRRLDVAVAEGWPVLAEVERRGSWSPASPSSFAEEVRGAEHGWIAPGLWVADRPLGLCAEDPELTTLTTLVPARDQAGPDPCTALTLPGERFGHRGAARGALALAQALHALESKVLPPCDPSTEPGPLRDSGLFRLSEPGYWFQDADAGPRRAVVTAGGPLDRWSFVALRAVDRPAPTPLRRAATMQGPWALGLSGADHSALRALATAWVSHLEGRGHRPDPVARGNALPDALRVAFVGTDHADLLAQLRDFAHDGIGRAPMHGRTAVLWPGSGNQRLSLGQRLSADLPSLYEHLDAETRFGKTQNAPALLWPHALCAGPEVQEAAKQRLDADASTLIFAQVSFGIAAYRVIHELGLRPDVITGYSLGASAAMHATRAWTDRDAMFRAFAGSPLYREDLAGARRIARERWGLGPQDEVDWTVGVIPRAAAEVRQKLVGTASLLIVNAPQESVVGGRRADVAATALGLGSPWLLLPGIGTVHNDLVAPVYDQYRAVHRWPVTPVPGATAWCPVRAAPMRWDADEIATSIADAALHGFDFTRLVDALYDAGVRHFVEVGPGASCTRMIGRILGDRPHAALSLDASPDAGLVALLRGAARLYELGLALDLSAFAPPAPAPSRPRVRPERRDRDDALIHRILRKLGTGGSATAEREPPSSAPSLGWPPTARTSGTVPPPATPLPFAPAVPARLTAQIADLDSLITKAIGLAKATALAHQSFLRGRSLDSAPEEDTNHRLTRTHTARLESTATLISNRASPASTPGDAAAARGRPKPPPPQSPAPHAPASTVPWLDRAQCLEFARGSIGAVLGPDFADADTYPTRVRLPDEPLMLCDRILSVEGAPHSMGPGALVTEHDVLPGAFYLDGGRAPICISVEAGQADLFLSAWLGIDHQVRGERRYRLLDATVRIHRDLPRVGETLRYHIRIRRFLRQGSTWMFFFEFDGTIDDAPVITMREGCAGFFSMGQLEDGRGLTSQEATVSADAHAGRRPGSVDRPALVDLGCGPTYLDAAAIRALQAGDLGRAFGGSFVGRTLAPSLALPSGPMALVHRVVHLDPLGGAAGLGVVEAETDVDPDSWYLVCHFVDDRVMPGTLMFEGAAHTLRVLALRRGLAVEATGGLDGRDLHWAPVTDLESRLRCRGQVITTSKVLRYRVEVTEWGLDPEPYVVGQAILSVDGRPVVRMGNVSLRIVGARAADLLGGEGPVARPAFDEAQVRAYCEGPPSQCFGPRYLAFDGARRLARLPREPFQFLSRVREVRGTPFVLGTGAEVVAEWDVPAHQWSFSADHQRRLPFCVVLEAALQPCGFLAAWCGAALRSDEDLHFRNLDGDAVLHAEIGPKAGTVRGFARLTECSEAAGMILVGFTIALRAEDGSPLYTGTTRFGFFPGRALAQQVGIRGADLRLWTGTTGTTIDLRGDASTPADHTALAERAGDAVEGWGSLQLPSGPLALLDHIEAFDPTGGPKGLGFGIGVRAVRPDDWYFAAHFYQDPVMPGSLGLEAAILVAKVLARARWPHLEGSHRWEPLSLGRKHRWSYRGQVVPTNAEMRVDVDVTECLDGPRPELVFHAFVRADGRVLYELHDFAVHLVPVDTERG